MRGVDRYLTGKLTIPVHLPEQAATCRWCPFCVADPSNHKREVCQITGELLPFADLCIDGKCPIVWEDQK